MNRKIFIVQKFVCKINSDSYPFNQRVTHVNILLFNRKLDDSSQQDMTNSYRRVSCLVYSVNTIFHE